MWHKDTARARLENAGFTVQPISESSDTVAADFVIRTDPPADQEVKAGTVIHMVVSTGAQEPDPVPVPNVVNTIQTEAENQLRAKGLIPEVVVDNHDSYAAGLVFKQEPAADTELQPGSTVKIYVSSGYKDVKLTVPLPQNITAAMDLQISVDGRVDEALSREKSGVIPADTREVVLNLELQKESYRVRIKIAYAGTNDFQDYYVFDVNGKNGTSKQTEYYPFKDADTPATTDPSTEPTDPVSSPESGNGEERGNGKAKKDD